MSSAHSFTTTSNLLHVLAYTGLGICAVLATLELILRILPCSTATYMGYYIDPVILTYRPAHEFISSFGWSMEHPQRNRANNFGFLTARDFKRDPAAVALIGDSYVDESFMPEADRLATRLETHLQGPAVFALGSPGSNLLDYAERVRFAHEKFGLTHFVIVIQPSDVLESLCGSGNSQGPCVDSITRQVRIERIATRSSWITDIARQSALVQYLVTQIRLDPTQFLQRWKTGKSDTVSPAPSLESPGYAATSGVVQSEFFARLRRVPGAVFVLVFDYERTAPGIGNALTDGDRAMLIAKAQEFGARVVDLEPIFRKHTSGSRLSLSVSPRDTHWNKLAIELVADAVAQVLRNP